jgi:hypothetical protein
MNNRINDIERYLNGQMSAAEMHAFETALLNDPFLAEATEGYRDQWKKIDLQPDLQSLHKQLNSKTKKASVITGSFRQWMSIAATLVVLLSVSVVLYRIFSQQDKQPTEIVASNQTTKTEPTETKPSPAVSDSQTNTIAITKTPETNPALQIESKNQTKQKTVETGAPVLTVGETKITNETASGNAPVSTLPAEETAKKDNSNVASISKPIETKMPKLFKFSGKVVDENNNPLPFANIKEQTSGIGTYADVNGNFTLVSADSILNVETKFIGYGNALSRIKMNEEQKIVLRDETVIANAPSKEALYERNKKRTSARESEVNEMSTTQPESGWSNYNVYIANNLREPQISDKTKSKRNEVELSFDVNPDGTLSNIKVERSNCRSCNNEAIRIVKDGPRWKSKTGKTEHTRFSIQF